MKTTLRQNTIETLQRQPAWKKLIDTLVDLCSPLFDKNLVADLKLEDGTLDVFKSGVGIGELRLFDKRVAEEYDNLDANKEYYLVRKYADTNAKYGGLEVLGEDLQSQYAALSYFDEIMHLNLRENTSLRGLLRTLSLYGCKIRKVETAESGLPHTFKVESSYKDTAIFGYNVSNKTYDYEARGITPNGESYGDDYDIGNVEADCYDVIIDKNYEEENTSFKYIYNIYGYNLKNPVISTSPIHEVLDFNKFVINNRSSISANLPEFLFIKCADVVDSPSENDFSLLTDTVYYSVDEDFTGIYLCDEDCLKIVRDSKRVPREDVIKENYHAVRESVGSPLSAFEKWVVNVGETSFVFNENEKIDLMKGDRIKYNSVEHSLLAYKLRFALTENANIERTDFTRLRMIEGKDTVTPIYMVDPAAQKKYYVYEDDIYHKRWIVEDKISDYFKTTPSFLKTQLFADECTIKAQPLFSYECNEEIDGETKTVRYVSMCPNFIDTETVGGVGKISYEIEMYNADSVPIKSVVRKNNRDNGALIAVGKVCDNEYFAWEQFSKDESLFFKRSVYSAIKFDSAAQSFDAYSLDNFFDGGRNIFYVRESEEKFPNNDRKVLGDSVFENTYKQELFETMYFNHFVKVYPIVDEESDNIVSTMKLYCDNLELVLFGDIVPYVVSYDRVGTDEDGDGFLDDIDCSIFSKIIAYNKRTHMITVNNPVFFKDSKTPKYVVVAYQNASPFNRIKALEITSPNIYDYKNRVVNGVPDYDHYKDVDEELTFDLKRVVGDMLADYVNENCSLNLYAECEYNGDIII